MTMNRQDRRAGAARHRCARLSPPGRRPSSARCGSWSAISTARSTFYERVLGLRTVERSAAAAALAPAGGSPVAGPARNRARASRPSAAAARWGCSTSRSCCRTARRSAASWRIWRRSACRRGHVGSPGERGDLPERSRTASASRSTPIGRARPGSYDATVSCGWPPSRSTVRDLVAAGGGQPWTGMPAGHGHGPRAPACRRPRRRGGVLPPRARLRQGGVELPGGAVPLGGRLSPSPRHQHLGAGDPAGGGSGAAAVVGPRAAGGGGRRRRDRQSRAQRLPGRPRSRDARGARPVGAPAFRLVTRDNVNSQTVTQTKGS